MTWQWWMAPVYYGVVVGLALGFLGGFLHAQPDFESVPAWLVGFGTAVVSGAFTGICVAFALRRRGDEGPMQR